MSTPLRRHRSEEADRAFRDAQQTAADALAETVRLRRALDALTSAIVIHDARGQLVLRNRQHAELDGNRHVSALVAAAVERLVASAQDGQAASQTLELHGPPPRTLDITAVPLGSAEVPLGTIAFVEDISERRRLEAVRRDFAANVSHELRTPIGALGVLAETLVDEDDPEVVRRLARHIMSEAERAGRLIEDLLDLSRIEAGGVLVEAAVDIVAVVATATERVVALAAQRDVRVVVHTPERGDGRAGRRASAGVGAGEPARQRHQVLGTGIHGRGRGGRRTGWVVVTVRDQGIGIPAKDLERIFERFYRVDRARSRETGGTGLGLSIVRHVATNHGGTVEVSSREGEGSTFTLRLPEAGAAAVGALMADTRPTVLVVEDEESFVEALTLGLNREGFAVRVARDGAEALASFDAARPDVVLLDLMLPRVSGIDVCRHIRARSSIPIIMVTAKDSEVDAVVGLEVGADDYVTKPYRLRELVARVRAVLRRAGPEPTDDDAAVEVLEVGDVALDAERHRVTVRGSEVALPLREFELLELLLDNAGRVLTRDTLIDRIWGPNYVGDTKTLDVHVKRLRSKIEDDPAKPSRITTIRGLGYRYEK